MNLKFDTVFLSKIRINDSEFTYSEKGKSGTIPISRIEVFEVVEGTLTEQGYLKIIADGQEHVVHFVSNHNKGLRELQERLGFSNRTEPLSVKKIIEAEKETESDYMRPLETTPVKIYISVEGIRYIVLGKERTIRADRIKSVTYKKAKFLSLGLLTIQTDVDSATIKTSSYFNSALEKWVDDINLGLYQIKNDAKANRIAYDKGFVSNSERNIACVWYKVTGINPNTNRRKSETFPWIKGAPVEDIEKASGLLGPYECEQLPDRMPSDAQLGYARRIGVMIPKDATMEDASIFLTRKENDKPLHQVGVAEWLIKKYICELKVYIPLYASLAEAHARYYYSLPVKERIIYFAMKVYDENKGTKYLFPHEATQVEQEKFKAFAEEYYRDNKFIESFERYGAEDLPIDGAIKKRLKAYDMANSYL